MRGIRVHVLRDAMGDFSNGGISGKHTSLWLVDTGLPRELTRQVPEGQEATCVRLTQTAPGYNVLVPMFADGPNLVGPMASGAYAIAKYGHEAEAWKKLGLSGAIPVHDRYETQAQYDALSR